MELQELLKFISVEDKRLREMYGNYPDEEKRILSRTVKLTEEVGELCNEVLTHCSFQRKEKLDKKDSSNLSEEFADVLITTLLLASTMGVDIHKALSNKVEKINKRYQQ